MKAHMPSNQPNQPSFEDCSSEAVTHDVRVEVQSKFAPEYSEPFQQQWRFLYTIRITNEGNERVQLLSRHWLITDDTGNQTRFGTAFATPIDARERWSSCGAKVLGDYSCSPEAGERWIAMPTSCT